MNQTDLNEIELFGFRNVIVESNLIHLEDNGFDIDHKKHSQERLNRYTKFMNLELTNENCHQMHYQCAYNLVHNQKAIKVICFDDTWINRKGRFEGKGATAVPFLVVISGTEAGSHPGLLSEL